MLSDKPSEEEQRIIEQEEQWLQNRHKKAKHNPLEDDNSKTYITIKINHEYLKMIRWCAVQKGFHPNDYLRFKEPEKAFSKFCEDMLISYTKICYKQLKEKKEKEKLEKTEPAATENIVEETSNEENII